MMELSSAVSELRSRVTGVSPVCLMLRVVTCRRLQDVAPCSRALVRAAVYRLYICIHRDLQYIAEVCVPALPIQVPLSCLYRITHCEISGGIQNLVALVCFSFFFFVFFAFFSSAVYYRGSDVFTKMTQLFIIGCFFVLLFPLFFSNPEAIVVTECW